MKFIAALLALITSGTIMISKHPAEVKPGNSSPVMSFGIVTDVQYCNCDPEGTRYYRNSTGKLRAALKSMKDDKVSFVVDLGDLIDRDMDSYSPVIQIFDSSGLKVFHVPGNHDYNVSSSQKKKIPVLGTDKKGYSSYLQDGFRFVFLNGNEISTYSSTDRKQVAAADTLLARMKKAGDLNAEVYNGGAGKEQLKWMSDQLDASEKAGEKVFIFCHFPLWPADSHNLLNYKEVLDIIGRHGNIIACFAGHNHSGSYGNLNMTHYVTLRGMVETENTNSYSVVEVYGNKIWIKGAGREKSQILAY